MATPARKILHALIFALAAAVSLAGCGGGADLDHARAQKTLTASDLTPIPSGPFTVAREQVLPTGYVHTLALPIHSIDEVRHYQTGTLYVQGRDYGVDNGRLVINAGGAIAVLPLDWPRTPDTTSSMPNGFPGLDGKPVRYSPWGYHGAALIVTYKTYGTPMTHARSNLQVPDNPRVTFIGDSITAGADASGVNLDVAPFQPAYASLVCQRLACASMSNVAVGGKMSAWGADNLASLALPPSKPAPDLLVIAFGMNDAGNAVTKEAFKHNLQRMIETTRAQSPLTSILLVSGMRANPDWRLPHMFSAYREAMHELAATYWNVGVVDVTAAYDTLLARKGYYSLTGSGVNHPNDYMHRIYADVTEAAVR